MPLTTFWEFYVDKGSRYVFKKEGDRYRLYFIGTHELIDKSMAACSNRQAPS